MRSKKNTSIYLWCFIFAVAISIDYLNMYIWRYSETLIFTGGKVLAFFIFLAGYILMDHFQKNKEKIKEKCAKSAWKYTGSVFKTLYPSFLGGVTLAFIIRNFITKTKLTALFTVFIDSIWEFLGISQIGAVGLSEQTTGAVILSPGSPTIWNSPLWIISAIIISSLILYYIVSKNEDFFAGIFAPIFIIITYASIGMSKTNIITAIGIPTNLARVMAGMSAGMLMYYVVKYLKNKDFSESATMYLSLIHIVLIMLITYTLYFGFSWNELTHGIIMLLFCTVLLVNKDYVSDVYNKSKMCEFIGKLSLYYYSCFIAFVFLLPWLFPEMTYHASILFTIAFSTCWAFIMMYVDDYVITPIFRTKKKTN